MTDETQATPTDETAAGTAVAEQEGGEEKKEKLQQTVDIKEVGPCRKHITVTIDRGDIDKRFDEKYAELVDDAQVPGFRPGKAPRQIVIRKFEKEVTEQVRAQVLFASLEQLAEDFDVAPLNPPDINPEKLVIPKEGPFIYEFEVEVRPQFDLPNYKGLKLKRPVRTFNEEDVNKEQTRILAQYGQLVPKTEGAAELGDFLIVDMTSKLGDRELGKANELTIRIDDSVAFKDALAKDFAKQTIGAKIGDKKAVDISLSDAVADPTLRGQTAQATLDIKDLKKMRLPELNEQFLGNFGVHNEEQFRELVRSVLERRLEYSQRQSAREQVLTHIAASATWELPRDLLLRQARKALARRVMEMQEAGLSEEEINARSRMLQQDVVNSTALSLKEHFMLQKLAEVEKIEVNDEEIEAEIERLADAEGESPRRVRARLEKDDLIETLAAQMIERKALNLILESAEWEDTPWSPEGGMASVEQQATQAEMQDPTAAPPEEEKTEDTSN